MRRKRSCIWRHLTAIVFAMLVVGFFSIPVQAGDDVSAGDEHTHCLLFHKSDDDPATAYLECINEGCTLETVQITLRASTYDYDGQYHGVEVSADGNYGALQYDLTKVRYYDAYDDYDLTGVAVDGQIDEPGKYIAKLEVSIGSSTDEFAPESEESIILEAPFYIYKPISISFDPGEGSGTMAPSEGVYANAAWPLPDCQFEAPEGKAFAGWNFIYYGDECTNMPGEPFWFNDNMTLTAVWVDKEPAFKTQSLTLGGEIGVNFYMYLPAIDDYDFSNSYMEFTVGNKEIKSIDPINEDEKNTDGSYYEFTCYVSSIQMADTITAVFHYIEGGEEKTLTTTGSVTDYIENYLSLVETGAINDDAVLLVHALADFGHYAQIFLSNTNKWELGKDYAVINNCYTTSYDNDFIDAAREDIYNKSALVHVDVNGNQDIAKITYSLTFDSTTDINIYITPHADYSGVISVIQDNINTADLEEVSGGRYKIVISGIRAHQLHELHSIELRTQEGKQPVNIDVAGLSYVWAYLDSGDDQDGINAICALYNYYMESYNYYQNHQIIVG